MKSLKITKKEREERKKKYADCAPCIDGGDMYPYGTRIDLNEETLEKLDMDKLPRVGTNMTITAKVKVTSVSENQREGGEKTRRVELQITDLEFGEGSAEDAVRAAVAKA